MAIGDWIVNMLVGEPTLASPDFNYPDVAYNQYEQWREKNLAEFFPKGGETSQAEKILTPLPLDPWARYGAVDYVIPGVPDFDTDNDGDVDDEDEEPFFPPDPVEPVVIPPVPPTPIVQKKGDTYYDNSVTTNYNADVFNITGDYIAQQTIGDVADAGAAQQENRAGIGGGFTDILMMMMMMNMFSGMGGQQMQQQQKPVVQEYGRAPWYTYY